MPLDTLRVECVVLAQSFETLWAYYSQSNGQLFSDDCREAAAQFLDSFEELSQQDSKLRDPKALGLREDADIEDIVRRLREWAANGEDYPYSGAQKSRVLLFVFLGGLKSLLVRDLSLERWPAMRWTSEEVEHSEQVVRWKGHLPPSVLYKDLNALIEDASSSSTIVVVADIRRSQDLMTYATTPTDFSERVVGFITATRELIAQHHGFFDKFTGDGYLVYFNEAICQSAGSSYIECFLGFLKEHHGFAVAYFQDWARNVKKLPADGVGLAIGADLGAVQFHDLEHHLVAVGDSIVWASRMASAASANEILVNNLLFSVLEKEYPELQFEPRKATTKAGESFLARFLKPELMEGARGANERMPMKKETWFRSPGS